MSDSVISVESLGKKYRIQHQRTRQRYSTLRDVLSDKTKAITGRLWSAFRSRPTSDPRCPASEDFWALRNVSFEIKPGEVLGVIGRNGAGKSTLLKILSRITEPTEGRARICGRVASLLEVGTGFHGELSGRENIFLNGAILGMTKAEIQRQFDQIVAFAEVEKFLDTPVKRYSSGMYVRLAFAVAAHLQPEILVVDEVLAVGDMEFQKRCLGRMREVSRGGRTVLFVSHNMAVIGSLCSRCLLLQRGRLEQEGPALEVIAAYGNSSRGSQAGALDLRNAPRRGTGAARAKALRILNAKGDPVQRVSLGDPVQLVIEFECRQPIPAPGFGIVFYTADGRRTLRVESEEMSPGLPSCRKGGSITCRIDELMLTPGPYVLTLGINSAGVEAIDYVENCAELEVEPSDIYGTGRLPSQTSSVFLARGQWSCRYE
jgi:lipopolysaccharide transport system ATP-binding protein